MKKLKTTIALAAAFTIIAQNVSAEINLLTGEYSNSEWRVQGNFKNVSGGNAAIEVLKPGKTVNDNDPYAYTAEIPLDENGNFDGVFPIEGSSGEYVIRVGANGQIFEKSFLHVDISEINAYLKEIAEASSVSELTDIFERDYGRLKAICNVEIKPEDKEYIYEALFDAIPSGGFDSFEELKKTVAEICILNNFMNAEQDGKAELEKLFEYFDDEYLSAISLWNDSELTEDNLKNEVVENLQKMNISDIDELQENFSEILIVSALKNANSKGKELKVVKLVSGIINADKYGEFSKLSETKQINILSAIKSGDYDTVAEYRDMLDDAYEDYKNESGKTSGTSGGNKGGTVYVPPVDTNKTDDEQNKNEVNNVFSDLNGYDWAGPAIESLYNQKIIQGKGNGLFAPKDNVKREEFTSMIMKALKLESGNAQFDNFTDVKKDNWYYSVVASAVEKEIIKGISETEFGAGRVITRQDAVVICKRASEACGIIFDEGAEENKAAVSYEYSNTDVNAFADMGDVSEYAKDAVTVMNSAGLVKGKGNGEFKPLDNMTRAEAAVVIERLMSMIEAAKEDINSNDIKMIKTLNAFGMYKGDEKGINQELKRGDAAKLLSDLLGITPQTTSKIVFDDCGSDNANSSYIYTMVERGYFLPITGTSFNSEFSLDYNEAVRMAVIAMGYEKNAQMNGEYPQGYLKIAGDLGILSDVSATAGGKITKSDFLKIFYNLLDENVLELNINGGEITYSEADEATFLSAYHGIFKDKGKVLANSRTGIGAEDSAGDGKMKIGTRELLNTNKTYDDFIGREVSYYYKEIDGEYELVYLKESNKTKVLTLNSNEIEDFKNMEYSYLIEGESREKTIEISKEANIIYNTQRIFDYSEDELNPKVGSVTFVDADGDGEYTNYDTVIISEYKNIVVNGIDKNNEIIYDKYSDSENDYTLNLKNIEEYSIKDKHGDVFGLRELREWDVLATIVTPDNKYAEITLIDECYAGKVTSVNLSDNIIYVDGKEYELSKDFRGNISEIKTGKDVTVYWDMFGNVTAVQFEKASYAPTSDEVKQEALYSEKIAILTKVGMNEETEKMFIKTYYSDDQFSYNEFAEKIKINGRGYNTQTNAGGVEYQLSGQTGKAVMLKINEANEIVEIITAAKPGEDDTRGFYQLNYDGESLMYGSEAANFGFRFKKGNSIYTIPESAADYSDLEKFAYNSSSFVNDKAYVVDGYSTDRYSGVATTIVYKAKTTASGSYDVQTGFVIGSINPKLDEDDNQILQIEGIEYYDKVNYGTSASFELASDAIIVDALGNQRTDVTISDLGAGDCIRFGENNGVISTIQLMYDYSEDSAVDTNGTKAGQGVKGYAYSLSDDGAYLSICTDVKPSTLDLSSAESGGKYLKSYWIRNSGMVTIVDTTGKETVVKKGSVQDILTYKAAGNGCSRVVLFTEWKATVYGLVVYIEE